jgi:sugar lactone lactonase YvrE
MRPIPIPLLFVALATATSLAQAQTPVPGATMCSQLDAPAGQAAIPLYAFYGSGRLDHFYTADRQAGAAALAGTLEPTRLPGAEQSRYQAVGRALLDHDPFPAGAGGQNDGTAGAQAWLFATASNPVDPDRPLAALYRMSWKCGDPGYSPPCASNPYHTDFVYTADPVGVDVLGSWGYSLDCIEGYIYPKTMPQPVGSERLMRKYNPERDDHAIFPESELGDMLEQGYTWNSGSDWLGYVYPNRDGLAPVFPGAALPVPRLVLLAGSIGGPGNVDGVGQGARFRDPRGMVMDADGNLYVADSDNHTIRRISRLGVVSTVAGLAGQAGSDDGIGAAARFNRPVGLALDGLGNLYVSDALDATIRRISPSGEVRTVAGLAGSLGRQDGIGAAARFTNPAGLAVDAAGNVYVADVWGPTLRKVTPAGVVTTLAGRPGDYGSDDGAATTARFSGPTGVALDAVGNLYVADAYNSTVRKITPAGVVSTLAGTAGQSGSADGVGAAARFSYPTGLAVDAAGNLFVTDAMDEGAGFGMPSYWGNSTIRRITPAGAVTTLAGVAGESGDRDGSGGEARFFLFGQSVVRPNGIVTAGDGALLVADNGNHTIRRVTPGGVVSTWAGAAHRWGNVDGVGEAARFSGAYGPALDAEGNVYVADAGSQGVRRITPGGVVSTLAVPGPAAAPDSTFPLSWPRGVAVAPDGAVIVADTGNDAIRRIGPDGAVTTLAGQQWACGHVDGPAREARFCSPTDVAVDRAGNIYVADGANLAIRRISPQGFVTTLAQGDRVGYAQDIAVDVAGNVYAADSDSHCIRKVSPAGAASVLAGRCGAEGYVDGLAGQARFHYPLGVAVDDEGNVYVADSANNAVRKITPSGLVSSLVGGGGRQGTQLGDLPGGLDYPGGVAVGPHGLVITTGTAVLLVRQ